LDKGACGSRPHWPKALLRRQRPSPPAPLPEGEGGNALRRPSLILRLRKNVVDSFVVLPSLRLRRREGLGVRTVPTQSVSPSPSGRGLG
jgi:hypothetical protein